MLSIKISMHAILITLFLFLLCPALSDAQEEPQFPPGSVNELRVISDRHNEEYTRRKAGAVEWAIRNDKPVRRVMEDGRVIEIQYIDTTGIPVYHTTFNFVSAVTVTTDMLHQGGGLGLDLAGSGYTAGVWDSGIADTAHTEFSRRVVAKDSFTDPDNHATHVTGTIAAAGLDSAARGMAYDAGIIGYDWNNDISEIAREAAGGLLISNHSYGIKLGWTRDDGEWVWNGPEDAEEDYRFGFYTRRQSRALDDIAFNAPGLLMVWSAGNSRTGEGDGSREPNGPYDCIGPEAIAKNVLAVGAVDKIPKRYEKPSDVRMTSFSSWGPSDDGRVKPDIVAPGQSLLSTLPDDRYGLSSGTSMSAPVVAGSLLLLQELYHNIHGRHMRAATLKGLVIHTAYHTGNSRGPDYSFGWGMLNTSEAAGMIMDDDGFSVIIRELNLDEGDVYEFDFYSDGVSDITATLSWTDPPGTPPEAGTINPPDLMLVNDLDLRITDEAGNVYYPWLLDPDDPGKPAERGDNFRDNIEKILIEDPEPRRYTVSVSHKGELENGSQDFSIIFFASLGQPADQANLYWIGGSGYWNDPEGWSLASGGEPAGIIPNDTINVVIDENSFANPSDILSLSSDVFCRSFSWLDKGGNSIDMDGNDIGVSGDLLVSGNMDFYSGGGDFVLGGVSGVVNTGRNMGRPLRLVFDNSDGHWRLLSDISAESIVVKSGTVDMSDRDLYIGSFSFAGELPKSVSFNGSNLFVLDSFVVEDNEFTVNAEGMTVIVDLEDDEDRVVLSAPSVLIENTEVIRGILSVKGDHEKGVMVNRGGLELIGNNRIAELLLDKGSLTYLQGGSEQVLEAFEVKSSSDDMVLLHSMSDDPAEIRHDEYVKFCFDYMDIYNVIAGGRAVYGSGENSMLSGETSGWNPGRCEDLLFARFEVEYPCAHARTRFVDKSDGKIQSRFWSFGDEAVSDDTSVYINPVYTYRSPGTYLVSLTISGNADETSAEREITIIENTLAENEIITDHTTNRYVSAETAPGYQWYLDGLPIPGETGRTLDMDDYTGEIRVLLTDDKCNRFSEKLVVTAIEAPPHGEGLLLYPNPVTSHLIVELTGSFTGEVLIEIIDLSGKVVGSYAKYKHDSKMDMTLSGDWPPGYYLVRISQGSEVLVRGVIKQ